MEGIKAPRGTRDILGEEVLLWQHLEDVVRKIALLFGYEEVRTPIFEHTELFTRGVGEETDIVQKEMYTFTDKGGRSLTLRPEGTAPVVRAYLEHGFPVHEPRVKWYYIGPMFRYERPQAGRMRQFHQFGFEALGFGEPACDAEVIQLAWTIYQELGLSDLSLEVNSIGCPLCKPQYVAKLREYLMPRRERLCVNCLRRLESNPLRVLDCKVERCQEVFSEEGFPRIHDSLCTLCREHEETLFTLLEDLRIPFVVNHRLVRGLDYYTRTVFEVKVRHLGAQDAIGGGGRYDGLAQAIGGPDIPGVGFAAGMERIVLLLGREAKPTLPFRVYLAPQDAPAERVLLSLSRELAAQGIPFHLDFATKSLKYHLKHAQRMHVRFVVIVGEREREAGVFALKDLASGEQVSLSLTELVARLRKERELC
ncbi:MAG: histidine--tRNA ligase [Candidatus Caldatribacterium sp.]|nr:histidine--tRNA ligase [Candidatus Caldatribacterium sp.]MDW8081692.1 histidine--tRNA ligase [Candidatus Calescibacterium sp.]